ncbi:MAG: metallophosphoesterase [Pseudomonadota bacterium]
MYQRIGIIGDVHAQDDALEAALGFLQAEGVDVIICTGDVADGDGDIYRCIDLLRTHNVRTVRGNHDRWVLQGKARHVPNAHLREELTHDCLDYLAGLPQEITLPTPQGDLLLCHGMACNDLQKIWPGTARMPPERSGTLDRLLDEGGLRFIVNGHVHYRTLIYFTALTLINAGTLKPNHHAGFSLLAIDTEMVHGYELEGGIHHVRSHPLRAPADTQVFTNTQQFSGNWQPVTLYA